MQIPHSPNAFSFFFTQAIHYCHYKIFSLLILYPLVSRHLSKYFYFPHLLNSFCFLECYDTFLDIIPVDPFFKTIVISNIFVVLDMILKYHDHIIGQRLSIRSRVWFSTLPPFEMWIESESGSTEPREDNWVLTWLRNSRSDLKSYLLDLMEGNANHVSLYCHLPVSCRSLVNRCGRLGSCKPQI